MTHLYNYQHNGEDILGVAFSPDEKKVVTTSKDVRVWNFSLLSDPTSMNDSRDANICIQFSGDRKYLITTNGGSIKLWDVVNEKPQKKIFIHEDLTLVTTFSEDISKVATAIWEEWRSLYIYDIEKDQEIFLRWDGYALSDTKIIFSPDARFLAITHYVDVSVYIYDIDQRKKIIGLKGTGQATAIVFSPDGQRIAISFASGEVKVWDTLHYNQLFLLRDHLQVQEDEGVGIESLSVSSDSSLIALGATNGTIYLYSLGNGQLFDILKGQSRSISSAYFSPNNQFLASYDSAGFIEIWQLNQANCSVLKIIYHFLHPVDAFCWRDNDHIVLASKGGSDGIPHFYQLTLEVNEAIQGENG